MLGHLAREVVAAGVVLGGQDLVAGLKAKCVEGHVPGAGGVLDNRHVVARAADQRGDGATKGVELVPWKEFRRFGRKALRPPRGPLRLKRARFQTGAMRRGMISNGSKDTPIADGVDHVDDSIWNGYAATPRRFVAGAGATLRGMARLLVLALLVALALASRAQAQAPVGLGTADGFAVLGGSTVTNTGPTVVNGDLGVSPGTAVTGFPPGTVNGTIHAADAVAAQAQSDVTTAYNDAAGRACNVVLTGTDLGGRTLTRGVYCFSSSAQLTGTLTLDAQGDPNAVFIFQIGSTLTTASGSTVNLINGAQSCNVFWHVGSSATLGTTTTFRGNIFALTSNTATTGATIEGRLLARNGAVTLDSNTVTRAQCAAPPAPAPAPGPGPGPDETGPIVSIPTVGGGRCVARDFRLRIRARDASGIRSVAVFLDGRLVRRTTSRRFFVRIRAERLLAGRHTIRVVARDRAGNRTVQTRRFRRCERPVLPDFTG